MNIAVGLVPVCLFLVALIFLDSFRLVRPRTVGLSLLVGGIVAIVCMFLNRWLIDLLPLSTSTFSRYLAPIVEEGLKAVFVVWMLRTQRVAFAVDCAIVGFAVGAGFALVENIYYLQNLSVASPFVWVVRGLGTAVVHGSTTAILAVLARILLQQHPDHFRSMILISLGPPIFIHAVFNHFLLPPLFMTAVILIVLLPLTAIVFAQSERATRQWLGVGFDTDMELLESITSGDIRNTRVGTYLASLKDRFPGTVVSDMLCLLRLQLELSLGAKGILLMRQTGIKVPPDPEVKAKLIELEYLEKSIGRTGQLAMTPMLTSSRRDLWQTYMLKE
ncbi:MAG: PrsW family intramembrane metalloprotease [candidate division Zixibacteria bacterium]|nr:PrsW family intramembrane metalloprotease [candidate division Zixibacteria bacterium]